MKKQPLKAHVPSWMVELVSGVANLDEYFGPWAIHEDRFQQIVNNLQGFDLRLHLDHQRQASAQLQLQQSVDGQKQYQVAGDGVAVIAIRGPMMKQASSMSGGTSTVAVRRALRSAAADSDVRSILLRIESPGGSVSGTQELAEDVAAAAKRKPLEAFIEDMGASAAYWVASQARKVHINAAGMAGSIGTYAVLQDASAMADKLGLKVYVVKAGEFKGSGTPGTPVTPEQLAEHQRIVNEFNEFFIRGVASGRGMSLKRVRELADGRVHIGQEAQKLGLVDSVSTFDAVISNLSRAKGPKMSTELEGVVSTLASAAATHSQIKAACPGATPEFVLAQLEAEATVEQAGRAWMKQLADTATKATAEASQARAEAEAAKKAPPRTAPGVDPVPADTRQTSAAGDDAIALWNDAVAKELETTKNRPQAVRNVVHKNKDLHAAYLKAVAQQPRPYGSR